MRFILFISAILSGLFVDAQSSVNVINRKSYLDVRTDLKDVIYISEKYSSSQIPIQLDLSIREEDNLSEDHFIALSKLPLTFFRFTVWKKEKFYCKGLDKLKSLDSLELGGYSQSFLKDASSLPDLTFLQLEIFQQDSTIKEKATLLKLKKLRVSLSQVYDLSLLFDSLPQLEFLDLSKVDAKFRLSSSMKLLKHAPIERIGFGLASIDTTYFSEIIFPKLKMAWLIGISVGDRNFNFEQFIKQNPTLEYVDLTMNHLSKEFVSDLRKKFPDITIDREW